jgi:transposase
MSSDPESAVAKRYFGMDIHRDYAVLVAVSAPHKVVMPARRVNFARLEEWLKKHVNACDEVAIEATVNAWTIYDLVSPLVARCVVADARQVRLISNAAVKTDAQDALRLANLLCVDMLPVVWVPPPHIREVRALVAHRSALIKRRTMAINRMRSVINRHNLEQPEDFEDPGQALAKIDAQLSDVERLLVHDDLDSLAPLCASLVRVEAQMAAISQTKAWRVPAARVMQLLGFGIVHTMAVLGAIGEIARFDSPQKLVGYTGLFTSIDQSGQKNRSGRITKTGRRDLRYALVEAARAAVRYDSRFKREYAELCQRMHEHKAIVAIARKLAELLWHLLHEGEPASHMTDQQRAQKFAALRVKLVEHGLHPIPSRFFVRQQMRAIGCPDTSTRFNAGKQQRVIASDAELDAFFAGQAEP